MKRILSAALVASALAVSSASAGTIYEYTNNNISQRTDAGIIQQLSLQYDTDSALSFSASLSNQTAQAAWVVLSPGSLPRVTDNQLAILYMDFSSGNAYAYQYNGDVATTASGARSYRDAGAFIASYDNVVNVDDSGAGLMISFDNLDVSALAPGAFGSEWTGLSFADQIGVWLHFVAVDNFAVGSDGRISEFSPTLQSWFDTSDRTTTSVPEPAGLAAIGLLGVMGVAYARRRKAKKA